LPTWLWQLRNVLDLLVVVFIDVLEQIEVNIKVISPHNLDTVRNIDKFCQFGHTYAPNLDLFSRFYLRFSLSLCTLWLHIEV